MTSFKDKAQPLDVQTFSLITDTLRPQEAQEAQANDRNCSLKVSRVHVVTTLPEGGNKTRFSVSTLNSWLILVIYHVLFTLFISDPEYLFK